MPFHRHFQVVVAISRTAVDVLVLVAGLPLRLPPPPALRDLVFCIISNMFFFFLFKRSNFYFEYFTVLGVVLWVEVVIIVDVEDQIDVVVDAVLVLVVVVVVKVVVEVVDTGQILHLVIMTRLSNLMDPVVGDSGTEHLWGIPVWEIEI